MASGCVLRYAALVCVGGALACAHPPPHPLALELTAPGAPAIEALSSERLLEIDHACDGYDPSLDGYRWICMEASVELRRRREVYLAAYEGFSHIYLLDQYTITGGCEAAAELVEVATHVLGSVTDANGTLPSWKDGGADYYGLSHEHAAIATGLAPRLTVHAQVLARCQNTEGLAELYRVYSDDLWPLAKLALPEDAALDPPEAWLGAILRRYPRHVAAMNASAAVPSTIEPLLSEAAQQLSSPCPTSDEALLEYMESDVGPDRADACACLELNPSEDPRLAERRAQLSRYDFWASTSQERRAPQIKPMFTDVKGPGAIAVAPVMIAVIPIVAILSALGGSKTEHHYPHVNVRVACTGVGEIPQYDLPEQLLVRWLPDRLVLHGLSSAGLNRHSSVLLYSVDAEGAPDGRYCQTSRKRVHEELRDRCPSLNKGRTSAGRLGLHPRGDDENDSVFAGSAAEVGNVEVPCEVQRIRARTWTPPVEVEGSSTPSEGTELESAPLAVVRPDGQCD